MLVEVSEVVKFIYMMTDWRDEKIKDLEDTVKNLQQVIGNLRPRKLNKEMTIGQYFALVNLYT